MHYSHSLGVISHVDQALAESTALSFILDGANVFQCSLRNLDSGEDTHTYAPSFVRFSQYVLDGEEIYVDYPIDDECATCAIREAIVRLILSRCGEEVSSLPQEKKAETIIVLPQGVELAHLMPSLSAAMDDIGVRVMGVVHLIDADRAAHELLEHEPIADRNAQLFPNDERCVAEIHQVNLGYADAIVALGEGGRGRELIEHLRPHDVLLFNGLEHPILNGIRNIKHDAEASIRRVHPATTQAWGGPCEYGTWTLDLYSKNPFHPERLKDFITTLTAEGVYLRGCFWLPTRPCTICSLEAIGEVMSVGVAGSWEDFETESGQPLLAHTHLILTGVQESRDLAAIEEAFKFVLFDDAEDQYSWVGKTDGFDSWFV